MKSLIDLKSHFDYFIFWSWYGLGMVLAWSWHVEGTQVILTTPDS